MSHFQNNTKFQIKWDYEEGATCTRAHEHRSKQYQVKNGSWYKILYIAVMVLCILPWAVWALTIVDIEESTFGKNVKHTQDAASFTSSGDTVRMVAFNVTDQKFDGIYYFMSQHNKDFTTAERYGITLDYGNSSGTFSISLNANNLAERGYLGFAAPF